MLKTCYFPYSAFWLTGQWGGAIAPPPRPSPGYATGDGQYRIPNLQDLNPKLSGIDKKIRFQLCGINLLDQDLFCDLKRLLNTFI